MLLKIFKRRIYVMKIYDLIVIGFGEVGKILVKYVVLIG